MRQKIAEKFEVLSLELPKASACWFYFGFLVLDCRSSLGSVWTGDLSIAVEYGLRAALR